MSIGRRIRPIFHIIELAVASSLTVTPLIVSVLQKPGQIKIGLMAGVPILVAASIFAAFGYEYRKSIWLTSIMTGVGFSLASSGLIAVKQGSSLILIAAWTFILLVSTGISYHIYQN